MKYKYDPEADVLSISISKKPFDYAEEMGDFIVHFDNKNNPVYVEILNANKFIRNVTTVLPKSTQRDIFHTIRSV